MTAPGPDPYAPLVGTASDTVPAILATGTKGVSFLFLSLSARHPEGRDVEYLTWHTLDHRPEQHRLSEIRASIRLVSTPACRAARAAAQPPFDAVDHAMSCWFTDESGMAGFSDLAVALRQAGRMNYALPSVQPGLYAIEERVAREAIKAGADVLPWWPAKGAYLLIEQGPAASLRDLVGVPGVVGAWSGAGRPGTFSKAESDQHVAYLFVDDDPVATAERLKPELEQRWQALGLRPLLAAPFHLVVPHAWDRHLP